MCYKHHVLEENFSCYVHCTDTKPCPIIGLNSCELLNFTKRIMTVNSGYSDLTDEFSDVFGEIGRLDKGTY